MSRMKKIKAIVPLVFIGMLAIIIALALKNNSYKKDIDRYHDTIKEQLKVFEKQEYIIDSLSVLNNQEQIDSLDIVLEDIKKEHEETISDIDNFTRDQLDSVISRLIADDTV